MIIELILPLGESQNLLGAWEVSNSSWEHKGGTIIKFIDSATQSESISYSQRTLPDMPNNIVLELQGNANQFYAVQNRLREYMQVIGGQLLVD